MSPEGTTSAVVAGLLTEPPTLTEGLPSGERIPVAHPAGSGDPRRTGDARRTADPRQTGEESDERAEKPVLHPRTVIRVSFHHGLGDCVYFAHLIPLYFRRGYDIEVHCTPDKRILFDAVRASSRRQAPLGNAPFEAPLRELEAAATGTQGPAGDSKQSFDAGRSQAEPGNEKSEILSHPWSYPAGGTHAGHGRFWQGSKMGHNISEPPLPHIGDKSTLWDEYCDSRIDIRPHLPPEALETASRWLAPLPRPIVLLHTKGNTGQERKSLPDAIALEFYKSLLDRFDGTIILLDWDKRVPRLASYRVRHLDDLGPCPLETLLALMTQADLMIGVDSGPLHLTRFTSIPTVGVWMPGHYPSTYALPREEQLNVVVADHTREWNRFKRIPWNIVEHPGSTYDPERLAEICVRMLEPPRYFSRSSRSQAPLGNAPFEAPLRARDYDPPAAQPAPDAKQNFDPSRPRAPNGDEINSRHSPNAIANVTLKAGGRHAERACYIAADVQLQQFIREKCRGSSGKGLSAFADRHRSFDVLFQEMSRRFDSPTVVETGTIRSEEDWGGAGFFTYLAAAYLSRRGGQLHSVDLSPANCRFARTWTEIFNEVTRSQAPLGNAPVEAPLRVSEPPGGNEAADHAKQSFGRARSQAELGNEKGDGKTVTVHCQDSVTFLQNFLRPIDVLYLDSLDTTEPHHAEHAERELEAAWPTLHDRSLIVIDDTPCQGGAWIGKGSRVVPLLLDRGWHILYAGYQVVLARATVPPLPLGEGRGEGGIEVEAVEKVDDSKADNPIDEIRTGDFPLLIDNGPLPTENATQNSLFPTPCTCTTPGWCARHQCEKTRSEFEFCRRLSDWFNRWEHDKAGPEGDRARAKRSFESLRPQAELGDEQTASVFPTPCECTAPGWCARHQCQKTRVEFEFCRRLIDWFNRWEHGADSPPLSKGGPGGSRGMSLEGQVAKVTSASRTGSEAHPTSSRAANCVHLGPETGRQACPTCGGHVELKIFACAIHHECSLSPNAMGIHCCQTCGDYQPP